MKYKLIIFDLDGTVLDTLEDLADSVNFALKMHNFPERNLSEIRDFVGNGIRHLIDLSVPENTAVTVTDSVFNTFKVYYKDHSCDRTKPYDGIILLLKELKEKGIYTAVVSNKADFAVKGLVDKYFSGLFNYYVGEKEGIPRKPAPAAVYSAIEHFSVKACESIYIGDSEVDIETANNAGLDSIIVTWGFRDEDVLKSAGAEKIVSDVEELKALISKIT